MPAARQLAQALRMMQRSSGRSLRSLARDTHVSHSSLSRYLRGEIVPAWDVVKRICEVTGGDLVRARELWSAADVRDGPAAMNGAQPGPNGIPVAGLPAPDRRRWSLRPVSPLAAAVAGTAAGLAAGVLIGVVVAGGSSSQSGRPASLSAAGISPSPSPSGVGGRYCPWKYVVTDGNPDDLRVFASPQHDAIIARYVPDDVFYAPDPPQIVHGFMKTEQGWIGMGNWVQRYHGSTCHVGGM